MLELPFQMDNGRVIVVQANTVFFTDIHTVQFFSISVVVWTCALGIQMVFFQFVPKFDNISLIYICAAVLQVLALSWTLYRNYKKKK